MSESSWQNLRQQVYDRADGCCEYCQTSQANSGQTMHVDHINPTGGDSLDNLCLSCWNCNTSKHTATSVIDPDTGETVPLFNPRKQVWSDHFEWVENNTQILGRTPIGQATVTRLKMNRPAMIVARERWVIAGHHPPKTRPPSS